MSLENPVKTNQLTPHIARPAEIQRLLAAASRNLADANATSISVETRSDAAYKTIMQCALVGLLANGYRPSTSTPGHHQTMIQALPLTLGVHRETWLVMDALRKKRNINDYSGDLIEEGSMRECIAQATRLLAHAVAWIKANKPELLEG